MTALTKWKLKKTLNDKEAIEVLQELYGNAKKTLNFSSSTIIDPALWKLYNDFETSADSDLVVTFTSEICKKPYLSFSDLEGDSYSHKISAQNFTIYIYE